MRNHWLDSFECDRDNKFELSLYEKELHTAFEEKIAIEKKLKAVNYRIEQLKLKIEELS